MKIWQMLVAMLAAFMAMFSPMAHATLSSEITAAIESAGGDLTEAATALILAMLGFWAVRKVGQKLGWW